MGPSPRQSPYGIENLEVAVGVPALEPPKVVVAVDLGATYSGFAWAKLSEPDKVHTFYDWQYQGAAGGRHYCKTTSSLWYPSNPNDATRTAKEWGYAAVWKYYNGPRVKRKLKKRRVHVNSGSDPGSISWDLAAGKITADNGHFVTNFKIHLAEKSSFPDPLGQTRPRPLPINLTPSDVVSDYLRKLGRLAVETLQKHISKEITMEDVQWVITVPGIWDENAKRQMLKCCEIAGLAMGPDCSLLEDTPSPHEVMIVLEPEAASVYCQQWDRRNNFLVGDTFLVVDAGGCTVDLVVHQKTGVSPSLRVEEVSECTGGLCGGMFVDQAFFQFLGEKIPCLDQFALDCPSDIVTLRVQWETFKHEFDDTQSTFELHLPAKLAKAWEAHAAKFPEHNSRLPRSYDSINLTLQHMRDIFAPVIRGILELIDDNLVDGLRAMMVVGGFAASPYLMLRIKQKFEFRIPQIINPIEPGKAALCGAVAFGTSEGDIVWTRYSRKTYGIDVVRVPFRSDDPIDLKIVNDKGEVGCDAVFEIFVRRGEKLSLDQCITEFHAPWNSDQTETEFEVLSTFETNPKYVDDPGVHKECSFTVSHPSEQELGEEPLFEVQMYFGCSMIRTVVKGVNFGKGEKFEMPSVSLSKTYSSFT